MGKRLPKRWENMNQNKITIADIAKKAKVNQSTVSRVLNNREGFRISEGRREKILSIAHEMNYEIKASAKSLATGKSYNIGIILCDLEKNLSSFFLAVTLSAFINAVSDKGYSPVIISLKGDRRYRREDSDKEILRYIRSERVDGFYIGSGMIGPKTLEELERKNIPAVTTDLYDGIKPGKMNFVWTDEQSGADELALELKDKGHKRVLYFMLDNSGISPRYEAFKKAVAKTEIAFTESSDLIVTPQEITGELNNRYEASELAEKYIEKLLKYSTVVCSTDLVAMGLCDTLKRHGRIPGKDISVAGYDNIEENSNFAVKKPFLTTIRRDLKEEGRQLARILMEHIDNPGLKPEKLYIPTSLIRRKSITRI